MLIPKLVSSKQILELVYSATGRQEEINLDDFLLNIAEVYDLLGVPVIYRQEVIGYKQDPRYEFDNYQVPLPCNFRALVPSGISVNGEPVRWSEDSFHYLLYGSCCGVDELSTSSIEVFKDNFGTMFSPQLGNVWRNGSKDITFAIYDDKITFNIKEGKVCLAYYSYPIDKEGYLEIPDDVHFKRALTDYIIWKLDYVAWRTGGIPDKVYQKSEDNKIWSIKAAINKLKMPSVEQMQVLQDTVVRLIPRRNEYYNFFKGMGIRENINFR